MKDLELIADCHTYYEIPKNRVFLKKYFKSSRHGVDFIRYYLFYNEWRNYSAHTGVRCEQEIIRRMRVRVDGLIRDYDEAKLNIDLEKLALLEAGKAEYFVYLNYRTAAYRNLRPRPPMLDIESET